MAYGEENIINIFIRFISKSKNTVNVCVDSTRPSLAIVIEGLKKSFLDAKSRGVRLRYLTEITSQNISYCKELLSIVDELRHLDGIKGNFYISDIEYLAPATLPDKAKPASQIIYSNVKEIVRHEQYVFDTFWNKAIPAEEKIREIEEGVLPNFIEILRNPFEVQKKAYELMKY
jgi:hypothetical protein